MSGDVDIRRVVEGDLEAIATFRANMEGGAYLAALRTPEFYRWKYLGEGGGIAVGAFRGDRVLGLLAGLPRRIRAGDSVIDVAELGEIFVDPEVQGRGVFRILHSELRAELARGSIQAITCRPARDAGKMLRSAFVYERMLTIAAGEHRVRGDRMPRRVPGIDSVPETEAGADFDGLDADLASDFTATVRSAAYVRRRYLRCPTPYTLLALRRGDRLEGWVVLLEVAGEERSSDGYLVDALVWPEVAARRAATAAVAGWFAERECARVFAWRADGPQDPPLLPDLRPLSRLRRLDYLVSIIRPEARALLRKSNRARWLFRMGDTDGI